MSGLGGHGVAVLGRVVGGLVVLARVDALESLRLSLLRLTAVLALGRLGGLVLHPTGLGEGSGDLVGDELELLVGGVVVEDLQAVHEPSANDALCVGREAAPVQQVVDLLDGVLGRTVEIFHLLVAGTSECDCEIAHDSPSILVPDM